MARAETDNKIELQKKFRPTSLTTRQNLGCTEIFKIFVVCDNVNRDRRTLEIMPPSGKGCKDRQELFVMSVVVDFSRGKGAGMESYRMNVARVSLNGEDGS